MLAVVLLNHHQVSSFKTVRPWAPCGAQCIGHAVRTWSAVCSEAPHSQLGEVVRPHLCMDKWNRPTPVCRQLSLTQAAWGKPIPTGLAPVLGTKLQSLEAFSQYSILHLWFVHSEAWMLSLARLSKRFHSPGTNERWILVSLGKYLRTYLKDHTRYDRGPEIHSEPRRCHSHSVKLSWVDAWEYR